MRQAKVTLIWEPVEECYISRFKEALSKNPEIESRLAFHDGYWESKDTFDEVNYCLSDEGKAFQEVVARIDKGVNEYMCNITNDVKVK